MKYCKEIDRTEHYQLAVCGGGFSGFATALAAAREGLKVILIERNAALGGVGTLGLVNHILGVRHFVGDKFYDCVGGIFAELERELVASGDGIDVNTVNHDLCPHGWKRGLSLGLVFENERMQQLLERKLCEAGVTLLYYTDIIDVIREGRRLQGVVIHNKSGLSVITADCFADATGDGDICALGGNGAELGDEEGGLAAASLEMHVENVDHEKLTRYMKETGDDRFKSIIARLKEEGVWSFPYEIFISVMLMKKDVFMINTIRQVGVNGVDARSLTDATVQGREESYKLLAVMRRYFPGFEHATLRRIAPVIGIRETRRIKARYRLTIRDLIEGNHYEDSIAMSGHGWDMPNPKSPSYQPYHGIKRKSPFSEIPYRCLLPESLDNVIAVGRCIGVEREVLGVAREMGPCIAMGETAGTAAALAIAGGCDFAEVDIKTLKARLWEKGALTDITQIKID